MDRDLALGLVRVTEMAALASAKYMGRGDKNAADQAAVDGMRQAFNLLSIKGTVVIGEGEMDEAPMLYIGEVVGVDNDKAIEVDIAVDPLDGTSLIAKGLPNCISVIAMAPKGAMLNAPDMYMEKIAVGPRAAGKVSLDKSVEENLEAVAKALNKNITDITLTIQDRPRHEDIIKRARKMGCRIKLFGDGDVATAIATGFEDTGIDILMGIGGAPEGVIAAAALKCMGGDMQGRLYPYNQEEIDRCHKMGIKDVNKIYALDELVKGDEVFFAATGISGGELLKGVVYYEGGRAKTHSIVMRAKTGTIRFVEADHRLDKNDILVDLMKKHSI